MRLLTDKFKIRERLITRKALIPVPLTNAPFSSWFGRTYSVPFAVADDTE